MQKCNFFPTMYVPANEKRSGSEKQGGVVARKIAAGGKQHALGVLHLNGFESAHKRNNKSHSECIIHYGIYWCGCS